MQVFTQPWRLTGIWSGLLYDKAPPHHYSYVASPAETWRKTKKKISKAALLLEVLDNVHFIEQRCTCLNMPLAELNRQKDL